MLKSICFAGLMFAIISSTGAHLHQGEIPTNPERIEPTHAVPVAKNPQDDGAVIKIKPGKNGRFYYTVYAKPGELVAMSSPTGFETENDVHVALEKLKQVLELIKIAPFKGPGITRLKQGRDERFYFTIYDYNTHVLALSKPRGWLTREEAIENMKRLKKTLNIAKVVTIE